MNAFQQPCHQARNGGHAIEDVRRIVRTGPDIGPAEGVDKMARILDFNWADEADLVVRPVQAVAMYQRQNGVVIRQQKSGDRDSDDVVTIPHHALGLFIHRLQTIYDNTTIEARYDELPEIFNTAAAE